MEVTITTEEGKIVYQSKEETTIMKPKNKGFRPPVVNEDGGIFIDMTGDTPVSVEVPKEPTECFVDMSAEKKEEPAEVVQNTITVNMSTEPLSNEPDNTVTVDMGDDSPKSTSVSDDEPVSEETEQPQEEPEEESQITVNGTPIEDIKIEATQPESNEDLSEDEKRFEEYSSKYEKEYSGRIQRMRSNKNKSNLDLF